MSPLTRADFIKIANQNDKSTPHSYIILLQLSAMPADIKTKHQYVLVGNRKSARLTSATGVSRNGIPEKWKLAQDEITSAKEQAVANKLIPQAFELAAKNGGNIGFLHQISAITPRKVKGSIPTRIAYDQARSKHHDAVKRDWHVVIPTQAAVSTRVSAAKPEANDAKYKIRRFNSVEDEGFAAAAYDPDTIATLNEEYSPELVERLFRVLNASTRLQAKPIPRIRNIEINLSDRSIRSRAYIAEKASTKEYLSEGESTVQANDKEALIANIQRLTKDAIIDNSDAVMRIKLNHVPSQYEVNFIMELRNEVYKIVEKQGLGAKFKFVVTLPTACEQNLGWESSTDKLTALYNDGIGGQTGVGFMVALADKSILDTINKSGVISTPYEGKVGIFCCEDNQYEQAVLEKLVRKSQH